MQRFFVIRNLHFESPPNFIQKFKILMRDREPHFFNQNVSLHPEGGSTCLVFTRRYRQSNKRCFEWIPSKLLHLLQTSMQQLVGKRW